MARPEINRSGEMDVFTRVVEQGGFSAAARVCRMTPSAVSKLVARLEARLGARLVDRSTRAFQLTPEGCAFYERAARILADIDDAERNAGADEQPAGRIRLNTSASYATHILAPILSDFLDRYPGVTLDLAQTDEIAVGSTGGRRARRHESEDVPTRKTSLENVDRRSHRSVELGIYLDTYYPLPYIVIAIQF